MREVRDLIREVGQDRTVLLSTHILSEVSQLCSRILIINNGQIVAEDSPSTLANRLQGTTRFFVRVGNAASKDVVKAIRGVKGIEEIYPTEDGVEITSTGQIDPRPAVAAAIVQKSWDLLELRQVGMSLEDIFLQLTTDEAVAEEED